MIFPSTLIDKDVPFSQFSIPFTPFKTPKMKETASCNLDNIDSQTDCPIFKCLPAELRNIIYSLVLMTGSPFIDPSTSPIYSTYASTSKLKSRSHSVPDLGIALLRTCKRIYSEAQIEPLFEQNKFRFTTAFSAQKFLSALPKEHRALIQDVEVDLRECSHMHPAIEREWAQYLAWPPQVDSLWAAKVGSLRLTVPNLGTLRFNIEEWDKTVSLTNHKVLRFILQGPKGFDKVVLTGANGKQLLDGSQENFSDGLGPVVFAGILRCSLPTRSVEWCAKCVKGNHQDKVVTWEETKHCVNLEVLSMDEFYRQEGDQAQKMLAQPDYNSTKGFCSLEQYERRWRTQSQSNTPDA